MDTAPLEHLERVAERDVRLGGGVVVHLLTKPVTEHDRRVLGVRGTGEESRRPVTESYPPEIQT
ncbi:MAG: hypothetical protein ACRDS9_25185 [Pseudonocardiaceae bacterium]